jgi:uncharacterized protein (DUF1697 family)
MTAYVALLRAVNVGGTGKLPMSELKAMCEDQGFTDVKTYIASGNVVFRADQTEAKVKSALESALATYASKPVAVFVRTVAQMQNVLNANPFADAPGNRVTAIFLDAPPSPDAIETAKNIDGEIIALGTRELYVHYVNGMGGSKLMIPAAKAGTARNMNTVAKLAEMAEALRESSRA